MNNTLTPEMLKALVNWYNKNKRSLPWRDTNNPYHTWISEIMLQQTRIEAVRPKYISFMEKLPDIQTLASCSEDDLMRLWEGLGYYSRARNLQKCARVLMEQYEGKLPDTYEQLVKLPGIGPYTAGAVASIAFHQPVPAVDGNVLRVLSRLFESTQDIRDASIKKEFEESIHEALQKQPEDASSFNQGIMELGQLICVPNGTPLCQQCPLQEYCLACNHKTTDKIPYRSPLKKRKIIHRTLFILRDGDHFLVHKRPSTGLLANLYEFPGFDESLDQNTLVSRIESYGFNVLRIKKLPDAKHVFTHLEWHMTAYELTVSQFDSQLMKDYYLASKQQLQNLAIPSAFKTYTEWYALRD